MNSYGTTVRNGDVVKKLLSHDRITGTFYFSTVTNNLKNVKNYF